MFASITGVRERDVWRTRQAATLPVAFPLLSFAFLSAPSAQSLMTGRPHCPRCPLSLSLWHWLHELPGAMLLSVAGSLALGVLLLLLHRWPLVCCPVVSSTFHRRRRPESCRQISTRALSRALLHSLLARIGSVLIFGKRTTCKPTSQPVKGTSRAFSKPLSFSLHWRPLGALARTPCRARTRGNREKARLLANGRSRPKIALAYELSCVFVVAASSPDAEDSGMVH